MASTAPVKAPPIDMQAMKAAMTAASSGQKGTAMANAVINALVAIADSNGGAVKNELGYIISIMKTELANMQTIVGA